MKSMVKSTRKIFMRILMTILAMCIMLFAAAGCEKEGTAASGTTLPASQTKTAVKVSASVAKTSQAASSVSSATKGTAATSASGAATSENQNNSSGYQNGTGDANETEASDNENMYDESTGDESNGSDIEEKVQIDLGGKNIKISCWADSMIIKEGGTTELTVKRYERLKWVEETYNCKFVWSVLPSATYSDLISAMLMAGSAEYDVCLLTKEKALGPYAVNNLIKPIHGLRLPMPS